jgi:hypothetical protein
MIAKLDQQGPKLSFTRALLLSCAVNPTASYAESVTYRIWNK